MSFKRQKLSQKVFGNKTTKTTKNLFNKKSKTKKDIKNIFFKAEFNKNYGDNLINSADLHRFFEEQSQTNKNTKNLKKLIKGYYDFQIQAYDMGNTDKSIRTLKYYNNKLVNYQNESKLSKSKENTIYEINPILENLKKNFIYYRNYSN